jgi:transcriptional regulator with XRE-family HTH domain
VYFINMSTITHPNLTELRQNAGLTMRELARQLKVHHTTVLQWEKVGKISKAEFIPLASEILGVTIEELLGLPKPRRTVAPGGKLGQLFRAVSELPRSQQQRISGTVEDMLLAQQAKAQ